jgi:hypothetical protein
VTAPAIAVAVPATGICAVVVLVLHLFSGNTAFGMNFDEVFRANNLWPWLDPAAAPWDQTMSSLPTPFGEIPLLYKQYVTSTSILRTLPAAAFEDKLEALRWLHRVYFLLGCSALLLALLPIHRGWAVTTALLVAVQPIFYPTATVGMALPDHLLWIALLVVLARRWRAGTSATPLLLAAFAAGVAVNQQIYFLWVVAALAVTVPLVRPGEVAGVLLRRPAVAAGAVVLGLLGLFNYLPYNLANGFETLRPLFLNLLDPEAYGREAIDHARAVPLLEGIRQRLALLDAWTGGAALFWAPLAAIVTAQAALALHRGEAQRDVLLPPLMAATVLILILLSPNATRPGHYVYLSPWLEMTLALPMLRLRRPVRPVAVALALLPLAIGAFQFQHADRVMATYRAHGGQGLQSPATLTAARFALEHGAGGRGVLYLQWGLYSQPYFLSGGRFRVQAWLPEPAVGRLAFEARFLPLLASTRLGPAPPDSVYLPFLRRPHLPDWMYAGRQQLEALAAETGLALETIPLEGPVEVLRLPDPGAWIAALVGDGDRFRPDAFRLERGGTSQPASLPPDEFGLWVIPDRRVQEPLVFVDGMPVRTFRDRDAVTARVPRALPAGDLMTVRVYDLATGDVSTALDIPRAP